MCVIFFHLANISIVNKIYLITLCKCFSCALKITHITPRKVRSPIFITSFSHAGKFFLSQSSQILQNIFAHNFELTERLRHTDITERYS